MPARSSYDYATLRVVPRVDRGEFINVGVVLFCRTRRFLEAMIELDPDRLRALAPGLDPEEMERHLEIIPRICRGETSAGPIARLSLAERFHWLVAPRSTIIQPGPVHSGLCNDPRAALDHLLEAMVRVDGASREPTGYCRLGDNDGAGAQSS